MYMQRNGEAVYFPGLTKGEHKLCTLLSLRSINEVMCLEVTESPLHNRCSYLEVREEYHYLKLSFSSSSFQVDFS
jgi:hypothetical protein